MKFAFIDGDRREAQPGLKGSCPACEKPVIAKCGSVKVWHWAHKSTKQCDIWWENETEWHRAWKSQFPVEWQEIVHQAESGEKHVADVKTDQGFVIEFQHSHIKPEERQSREAFYKKLVWVIDGKRRKRDLESFAQVWRGGQPINGNGSIRRVAYGKHALLQDWAVSTVPVFLDFKFNNLFWMLSSLSGGVGYVMVFSRDEFIQIHRAGATQKQRVFDEFVRDVRKLVAKYEDKFQIMELKRRAQPLLGFERYLARGARRKRRM